MGNRIWVKTYARLGRAALTMLLISISTVVALAPPASAATVVSRAYWNSPQYCVGYDGWVGYPVALENTVSDTSYSAGEIVRVTMTIGDTPGKNVTVKGEGNSTVYYYDGIRTVQGGWSGAHNPAITPASIVGFGGDGHGTQIGTSVRFVAPDPKNDGNNTLFGPGDSFWIDYRAPAPLAPDHPSQIFDYWGGEVDGVTWNGGVDDHQNHGSCQLYDPNGDTGPNHAPTSLWSYKVSEDNPREVRFTDLSSDPDDDNLDYLWSFDDGTTSEDASPTHEFDALKDYRVSLTVTDPKGEQATSTQTVSLTGGLVVNSTGDDPATDAATKGCDTGGTVGDATECTLRAAVQAAVARGGGDISFDIDGGGVPTITLGSELPELGASISIDGTTQSAGRVHLDGGGVQLGLFLTKGTSTITGLVIDNVEAAILIGGGKDHTIADNHIGINAAGTATQGVVGYAVFSQGVSGVVVRDNLMRCAYACAYLTDSPDAVVADNRVSVGSDGAGLGLSVSGLQVIGAPAQVTGNVIRSYKSGILVSGPGATGTSVEGNRIGVGPGGADLRNLGEGIRIDAVPGVSVKDNTVVAGTAGGILVSGSSQLVDGHDPAGHEEFSFLTPEVEQPGAVTGTDITVSGNTVGLVGDGTRASADQAPGVVVWAGARQVSVKDNTVVDASGPGIELLGGSGHRVTGNRIGTATNGTTVLPTKIGILTGDTEDPVIGQEGAGNTVHATSWGIRLDNGTVRPQVTGNDVTAGTAIETAPATATSRDRVVTAPRIEANTLHPAQTGVEISGDVSKTVVTRNVVLGGETAGINLHGGAEGAEVSDNIVLGAQRGVLSDADQVSITGNRVGIDAGGATTPGTRYGIIVAAYSNHVNGNVVVGSSQSAISIENFAEADLRGNQISGTGGPPILTEHGPQTPVLTGAIQQSTGDDDRAVLVIGNLPKNEAGRIEVFANDSCTDAEAEQVLDLVVNKKPGHTIILVPVVDRPGRDHFTVTYTSPTNGTSALSPCADRGDYPDTDGDGTVDPIEDLAGTAADPSQAVLVTDAGDVLELRTNFGTLTGVSTVADPAPGSHPAGFSLPYGVLDFQITGVFPGQPVTASVYVLDGDAIAGDAYYKYGPPTPGADPQWYAFAHDEDTGTGATRATADLGTGFVQAWQLTMIDGGPGDEDGTPDGIISDPGGPVLLDSAGPSHSGGTTGRSDTAPRSPGSSSAASGQAAPAAGSLAATGAPTDAEGAALLALTLLSLGLGLVLRARSSRHRRS